MTVIIIVNHNGHKDTIECLQSLLALENQDYKVIIVDNSKDTKSLDQINAWLEKPTVVNTLGSINVSDINYDEKLNFKYYKDEDYLSESFGIYKYNLIHTFNNGFAAANNIAIRWALSDLKCDLFWLLNNDTVVEKNSLDAMIESLKFSNVDISGSILLEYFNNNIIQSAGGKYYSYSGLDRPFLNGVNIHELNKLKKINVDYPLGASLFVTRKFVDSVGAMEERYFLYFEELDWVNRGRSKGLNFDICIGSRVYHKGGSSINNGSVKEKSKLGDYFGFRNRFLITKKFYKRKLIIVYVVTIVVLLNRLRKRQFDRVLFFIKLCLNPNISNDYILLESQKNT